MSMFDEFFAAEARMFLLTALRVALSEDGPDLTSQALFGPSDLLAAQITAKQDTVVAGLPIIPLAMEFGAAERDFEVHLNVDEGDRVSAGAMLALIRAPAARLLAAERVMLNFICHMSGVAEKTRQLVDKIKGTGTRLLDTRKTLPGLRYPEKYAVRVGGGFNHRMNLSEMLMLKDNHIDRAGSITAAVEALRRAYDPCPPIEVECRTPEEVREAAAAGVERIMLDNMGVEGVGLALPLVPEGIETEVSGNVTEENIAALASLGPDFISVGAITHSAPSSDLSMRVMDV